MPQKLGHMLTRHSTQQILIMQEFSPEITVDPGHTHPTNNITKHQQDHLPAQVKHTGKPRTGNTSKSPLVTHPQNTVALMNRTVTQRII